MVEKNILLFMNAIEYMEKILACAICLETSSDPVETRCGHLFCRPCIQEIMSRPGDSCPLCKLVLTRRNVLSGSHMKKCVQQLSKLVDSIQTDSCLDVREFLKMHHKKRSFVVSSSCGSKKSNDPSEIPIDDKKLRDDAGESQSPLVAQKSGSSCTEKSKSAIPEKAARSQEDGKIKKQFSLHDQEISKQVSIDGFRALATSNNINVIHDRVNTASNRTTFQKSVSPQLKSTDSRKLVRFKKLGNLSRLDKARVPFLYFGVTKKQNVENSLSTPDPCKISFSRLKKLQSELSMVDKLGSHSPADTAEPPSYPLRGCSENFNDAKPNDAIDQTPEYRERCSDKSLCSNPRTISARSTVAYSPLAIKSGSSRFRTSLPSFPSFRRSKNISPRRPRSSNAFVRSSGKASLENWKSEHSEKIIRKRKRSESSDEHGCRGNRRRDYSFDAETPLRTTVTEPFEDVQGRSKLDLNNRIPADATNKYSEFEEDSGKSQDSKSTGDRCTPTEKILSSDKSRRCPETIASNDSLMDITGEELLFKKFEDDLFRGKDSNDPCKPTSSNGEQNERGSKFPRDSSQIGNDNLPRCREEIGVKITETNSVGPEVFIRNINFMDSTPIKSTLNNRSEATSVIHGIQLENRPREHVETSITPTNECKYFSRRRHPIALKRAEVSPLHQSTPKSSHRKLGERCAPKADEKILNAAAARTTHRDAEGTSDSPQLQSSAKSRLCILCSGLNSKQIAEVKYFTSLFPAKYMEKFSSDVTHVIVKSTDNNNAAYKTLKYLQGIAHRKWVVNIHWIVNCIAQRKIIDEEKFEVVDSTTFIAGPMKARLGEKSPFENFVFLCIEPFMNISQPDYEDLLQRTGAKVVSTLDEIAAEKNCLKILVVEADYHDNKIIDWHRRTRAVPVAHEWIIECISQYRLVPLLPFLQELLPQDVLDLGFPPDIVQKNDMDFIV